MPPLLEYLDSLLTGSGQDLKLRTFKLVDQVSGRTLGVRADMTPQVARIDAHLLNRQGSDATVLLRQRAAHPAGVAGGESRTHPDRCRTVWVCRGGGRPRGHPPDGGCPDRSRLTRSAG
jgi:hypothetical protein